MDIPELKELEMTKADLAKALGIRVQTIYKWKRVPEYVEGYLLLMKELRTAYSVIPGEEYGPTKDKEH